MSRFVCLMYHDVCRATDLGHGGPYSGISPSILSYAVTTELLRSHVAVIGRERWMDPSELRRSAAAEKPEMLPRVLLTFDDGWNGSFAEAEPILQEAGARAIVFVTTGLIGHPLFASEALLRDISEDVFEIGAHTVTHPFLAECSTGTIRGELADSRRQLEDITGRTVDTVSIPNGSIDARVLEISAECGYAFVFTSETRVNGGGDRVIGRVAVRSNTNLEQVARWSAGKLGGAGWKRRALDIPKRVLGPDRYRRLRGWALGAERNEDDMAELVSRHRRNLDEIVAVSTTAQPSAW